MEVPEMKIEVNAGQPCRASQGGVGGLTSLQGEGREAASQGALGGCSCPGYGALVAGPGMCQSKGGL